MVICPHALLIVPGDYKTKCHSVLGLWISPIPDASDLNFDMPTLSFRFTHHPCFLSLCVLGTDRGNWGESLILAEPLPPGPTARLYLEYSEAAPSSSLALDDHIFSASLSLGAGESKYGCDTRESAREVV